MNVKLVPGLGRAGQVLRGQGDHQGQGESRTRQHHPGRSERGADRPNPEQAGRILPEPESAPKERRPGQCSGPEPDAAERHG